MLNLFVKYIFLEILKSENILFCLLTNELVDNLIRKWRSACIQCQQLISDPVLETPPVSIRSHHRVVMLTHTTKYLLWPSPPQKNYYLKYDCEKI